MQLQQIQTEDGQVVEQLVFEQIPITHIITTDQLQETEHVKVKVKAKEPRQPSIKPPVGKVWRLVIKNIAELFFLNAVRFFVYFFIYSNTSN